MRTLSRIRNWLTSRSKAKPIVTPWAPDPDDDIQARELWVVIHTHMQADARMHRATRAFVVMMTGPVWGTIFATAFTTTIGVIVGGSTTGVAGIVAAYNRGVD